SLKSTGPPSVNGDDRRSRTARSLVRPGRPLYPVLVHRAAALLRASFRPRLAATPSRFANPSPPSGWIEDSHLQAVDHARHTNETPSGSGRKGFELGSKT